MNRSNWLASIFDWLGDALERFNPSAFRFLAALLPYLTPIPVAWLTAHSASSFLHFTPNVSFVFVFALEGIGLWFTTMLVDSVVDWVRSKNPKALIPVLMFGLTVGAYVLILVNLNVTLENASGNINPALSQVITLMCFLPLITGVGNGYYKLKLESKTDSERAKEHQERLEEKIRHERSAERLERLRIRTGKVSESSVTYQKDIAKVTESSTKVSENFPKDWRKLRPLLKDHEVRSLATLSADGIKKVSVKYGVDERTVINWRTYAKRELGIN
jgi:hypothetical protein